MSHPRLILASASLALSLALASPSFPAEMQGRYDHSTVQVSLPGSYLAYSAERAPSPTGPWTSLFRENTNCLSGCGFQDFQIDAGRTYYYQIYALGTDHTARSYGPVAVAVPRDPLRATPAQNPSSGALRFQVHVPPSEQGAREFELRIYGLDGRLIRTQVTHALWAGERQVTWDGRDQRGEALGSGLYFYRLAGGPYSASGRILRVK